MCTHTHNGDKEWNDVICRNKDAIAQHQFHHVKQNKSE
jgi:hypothetical protein